jgi:hypothetical protein
VEATEALLERMVGDKHPMGHATTWMVEVLVVTTSTEMVLLLEEFQ